MQQRTDHLDLGPDGLTWGSVEYAMDLLALNSDHPPKELVRVLIIY